MAIMASQQYVDRKFEEIKRILMSEKENRGQKRGPILLRGVDFKDHPVLGNLKLDFCNSEGTPVDTVIIAGENGTGKSTILDALNGMLAHDGRQSKDLAATLYIQLQDGLRSVLYTRRHGSVNVDIRDTNNVVVNSDEFWGTRTIFSDVDINFRGKDIASVTSMDFDSVEASVRSSNTLASEIKQLIVDIQAQDDAVVARAVEDSFGKNVLVDDLHCLKRMSRLTKAFDSIFPDLRYDRVVNKNGHKTILFKKCGVEVPLDDLSSGEKQIVYRGCFMLRNINALTGAFVFIDEPEISMHPEWQKKILNFYKAIFTNESGIQTSQLFVVTHSPFVIHNDLRSNDKVIVLQRDEENKVSVRDSVFYQCNSIEAVKDAFKVDFSAADQTGVVYVEGRTDEDYFNKAIEVFGLNVNFKYKWIGHEVSRGHEENTGDSALSNACAYFKANKPQRKVVLQYDCDAKHAEEQADNLLVRRVAQYENAHGCVKGTENALVLDSLSQGDWQSYFEEKEKSNGYGYPNIIRALDKTKLCSFVCAKDNEELKVVFRNLKQEIEKVVSFFAG